MSIYIPKFANFTLEALLHPERQKKTQSCFSGACKLLQRVMDAGPAVSRTSLWTEHTMINDERPEGRGRQVDSI